MKKIITLILIAIALVGCNEVNNEVTIQTEEVHDSLYKKLKFYRCKMDIFNLMTENESLIRILDANDPFRGSYAAVVYGEITDTQDTLALFYACDKMVK